MMNTATISTTATAATAATAPRKMKEVKMRKIKVFPTYPETMRLNNRDREAMAICDQWDEEYRAKPHTGTQYYIIMRDHRFHERRGEKFVYDAGNIDFVFYFECVDEGDEARHILPNWRATEARTGMGFLEACDRDLLPGKIREWFETPGNLDKFCTLIDRSPQVGEWIPEKTFKPY